MDDLVALRADERLINRLACGAAGTDLLTMLLAAWIADVATGPPPVERWTSVTADTKTMTRDELLDEARRRFGDDPADFAFVCPRCGDVATVADFQKYGLGHRAGSECIGRLCGALQGPRKPDRDGVVRGVAGRGCNWTAGGLFRGPWTIIVKPGVSIYSFALAPATVTPEPVA